MWNPISDPFIPPGQGVDCPTCTPALFAAGEWPNAVYVTFSGIVPCSGFPDPPNGVHFRLVQTIFPCIFTFNGIHNNASLSVALLLAPALLWLHRNEPPIGMYFYSSAAPCSELYAVNTNTCPPDAGTGGQGLVGTPALDPPQKVAQTYGFTPLPGGQSVITDVAIDHAVLTLRQRTDHTVIQILFDHEELPAD